MKNFNVQLKPKDIEPLLSKYQIDSESINYKKFLQEVEKIHYDEEEKENIIHSCANKFVFNPKEKEKLSEIQT